MRDKDKKIRGIGWLLILALTLPLTACGKQAAPEETRQEATAPETESEIEAPKPEIDLSRLTPAEGAEHVYVLQTLDNTTAGYDGPCKLGQKILLPCCFYASAPEDTGNDEWLGYSFRLFDPYAGEITAELDNKDSVYASYFVAGDRLVLWNRTTARMDVFDADLQFETSYEIPGTDGEEDPWFCFGKTLFPCVMNVTGEEGWEYHYLTQDENGVQAKRITLPVELTMLSGLTDDGRQLIMSGEDRELQKQRHILWDPEKDEIVMDAEIAASGCIRSNRNRTIVAEAATVKGDYRLQTVQTLGGTAVYFKTDVDLNLLPMEGGGILGCRNVYGSSVFTMDLYDARGVSRHHLQMDRGEEDGCLEQYLEFDNYLVWMKESPDNGVSLLLWDMDADGPGPDLEQAEDPRDPQDRGGQLPAMEELYARAKELGEKYQINIHIADRLPEEVDYRLTPLTAIWPVKECLDELDRILGAYPEEFFTRILFGDHDRLNLYVVADIVGDEEADTIASAGAYVNEHNGAIDLVVNGNERGSWETGLSHEFAHLIDRRLDYLFWENAHILYDPADWNALNPQEFSYYDSYSFYDTAENWDAYAEYSDYFMTPYSMIYQTEDRAELFGEAMYQYFRGEDSIYSDYRDKPILRKKMALYCQWIRDALDTDGWPEQLPWEYVLEEYGTE